MGLQMLLNPIVAEFCLKTSSDKEQLLFFFSFPLPDSYYKEIPTFRFKYFLTIRRDPFSHHQINNSDLHRDPSRIIYTSWAEQILDFHLKILCILSPNLTSRPLIQLFHGAKLCTFPTFREFLDPPKYHHTSVWFCVSVLNTRNLSLFIHRWLFCPLIFGGDDPNLF
uniref:Uncharacterized protein n=1 Tax=Micrurus lemniscatus lemniscatus TaxID=129467 RepID=A0A2D4IUV2_MICLE